MNKSIFSKNNSKFSAGINVNDLSATSSVFMSNIKQNLKGGFLFQNKKSCPCNLIIESLDKNDGLNLALYLIKNDKCCFKCKNDEDGNTILHKLVLCAKTNDECKKTINELIKSKRISNSVDIQNKKGQTPLMTAAKDDNEEMVEILFNAGANTNIPDNDGNIVVISDNESENNINKDFFTDDDTLLKQLENLLKKNKFTDNIIGNYCMAKFRDRMPTMDSEISIIQEPEQEFIVNMNDIEKDNKGKEDEEGGEDNEDDQTDRFIDKLRESYLEKTNKSDSIDTDIIMEAIKNIDLIDKKNLKVQGGGAKNKSMGYRNMNLTDSDSMFNINTSESYSDNGISDNGYELFYDNLEYGRKKKNKPTNQLERMMSRQRDNLHQQVLDRIMSMLNKGELSIDGVVIKANERNSKLIKAYIYRKVSEKNPQTNGLDKILSITKMSEQQISDMIEDMPNLDDLEKNIQDHIKQKEKTKSKKSSDSDSSKTMDSDDESETPKKKSSKKNMSDTLDFDITETTESEAPKKKSSKKSSKDKKSKKNSKK
jgi:hypothetical protein